MKNRAPVFNKTCLSLHFWVRNEPRVWCAAAGHGRLASLRQHHAYAMFTVRKPECRGRRPAINRCEKDSGLYLLRDGLNRIPSMPEQNTIARNIVNLREVSARQPDMTRWPSPFPEPAATQRRKVVASPSVGPTAVSGRAHWWCHRCIETSSRVWRLIDRGQSQIMKESSQANGIARWLSSCGCKIQREEILGRTIKAPYRGFERTDRPPLHTCTAELLAAYNRRHVSNNVLRQTYVLHLDSQCVSSPVKDQIFGCVRICRTERNSALIATVVDV